MRISLNLYRNPVYNQNYAFRGQGTARNKDANQDNAISLYSKSGLRPATLQYDWRDMSPVAKTRYVEPQTDANTSGNAKEVHKKAHPTKLKVNAKKPMSVDTALKTFKNPNDMQDYYTSVYDARKKIAETTPEIRYYDAVNDPYIGELARHTDYKVNYDKLDSETAQRLYDSEREQVRLGALFAYWSVHYDGGSRYGYKKPPYIRTTHELITSLCNYEPYFAPGEFKRFLKRLPRDLRKKEDIKQITYDDLLEEEWARYRSLPFFKRLTEPYPVRKLTFLEKEESRVNDAYKAWADEERRIKEERANAAKTELEVRASGSLL